MAFIASPSSLPAQYRLLLAALVAPRASIPLWWDDIGTRQSLYRSAAENELDTLFAHQLAEALGWDALPASWRQAHEHTNARISAYMQELDRVANRLAEKGIPLVALKNGGIARGLYPCPGCVPMGDMDVLVRKQDFRQAHQVLHEEGYRLAFRSPLEEAELKAAERDGSAEYQKSLPDGSTLWFELQSRPVAGRWIRPDQEPSPEELIARSIPIPGTAVRLLAPEGNLLQVALHTAKHSYVRAPGFRLHLDVERIVRAYPDLDWALFVRRVQALQAKTAVYIALAIPKDLFGTPIPEEMLNALRPPRWKVQLLARWLNRVGLFNPDERKFGRLGYIVFTALLYDDLSGLWRAIFPDRGWMREHYGLRSNWFLTYYYGRRLFDLAFRRLST